MARQQQTQAPLYAEPCLVCGFPRAGDHEPWCPQFMRGAVVDETTEQPSLLEALDALEGHGVQTVTRWDVVRRCECGRMLEEGRRCSSCGADVVGNDPHGPDCPRGN